MDILKNIFISITSIVYVISTLFNLWVFIVFIYMFFSSANYLASNTRLSFIIYNFWQFLMVFWVLPFCWVRRQNNPASELWKNQWYMNLQYAYWISLLLNFFLSYLSHKIL